MISTQLAKEKDLSEWTFLNFEPPDPTHEIIKMRIEKIRCVHELQKTSDEKFPICSIFMPFLSRQCRIITPCKEFCKADVFWMRMRKSVFSQEYQYLMVVMTFVGPI